MPVPNKTPNLRIAVCGHCGVHSSVPETARALIPDGDSGLKGGETMKYFTVTRCLACTEVTVRYFESRDRVFIRADLVHPVVGDLSDRLSNLVPNPYRLEFNEAQAVIKVSPKASAALSRRLLQQFIRDVMGITKHTLAQEIEEASTNGDLSGPLRSKIDAVRLVGNFAAHPLKSQNTGEIFDVEPGEAEWNLGTLSELLQYWFVERPRQIAQVEQLNAKLAEAGKQPVRQFGGQP